MREKLRAVMRKARRNEALIEYMEINGMLPEPMRSISDVAKDIIAGVESMEGCMSKNKPE